MATIVIHPEKDQLKPVKAFLKALNVTFEEKKEEKLPQHVIDGIQKGQEDIKAGRSISFDELKHRLAACQKALR
ncbi:DUF2683 family protein [Pedobacter deserti]|uniref:DUF2683 family protein n=1 Tax=Pedobacter deserti TaxID=2817382 RepID=UPI00210EBDB1|nr:DUF2683 family protein [Pedobacter sp. SYSU D00382]